MLRVALGAGRVTAALLVAVLGGKALSAMLSRASYPFVLEWMEGLLQAGAERVARGEALYTAPSLEWTAPVYGPGWYQLAAAWGGVWGTSLPSLRALSLAATVATAAVLAHLAFRAGAGVTGAVAAAGAWLSAWVAGGTFHDLARVDALAVLALVLATCLAGAVRSLVGWLVVGTVLGLAITVKQGAVAALPALCGAAWWLRSWRGALACLTGVALVGVAVWNAFDAPERDWLWRLAVTLPRDHGVLREWLPGFWTRDVWGAPALGFVAALLASRGAVARRVLVLSVAAWVPVAWLGRVHPGMFDNVLLPLYAAFALAAGLALGLSAAAWRSGPALLLITAALLALPRDFERYVPVPADRAAGDALVVRLRSEPAPLWLPFQPELALVTGHGRQAHWQALRDVLRVPSRPEAKALRAELDAALREHRFRGVVVGADVTTFEPFAGPVSDRYPRRERLIAHRDFWTRSGWLSRPEWLLLPAAGERGE